MAQVLPFLQTLWKVVGVFFLSKLGTLESLESLESLEYRAFLRGGTLTRGIDIRVSPGMTAR